MTDTIRERLTALVETWRKDAAFFKSDGNGASSAITECADDLNAILAAPDPAPAVVGHGDDYMDVVLTDAEITEYNVSLMKQEIAEKVGEYLAAEYARGKQDATPNTQPLMPFDMNEKCESCGVVINSYADQCNDCHARWESRLTPPLSVTGTIGVTQETMGDLHLMIGKAARSEQYDTAERLAALARRCVPVNGGAQG